MTPPPTLPPGIYWPEKPACAGMTTKRPRRQAHRGP